MQSFLPVPSFEESAKCLDNKRLGKQRIEAYQILKTLIQGPVKRTCKHMVGTAVIFTSKEIICPECNKIQSKTPWYNHPAVQQWKGYERALAHYGLLICEEWTDRDFNDSVAEKIDYIVLKQWPKESFIVYNYPPWLGNEQYHASHRSNLLRKDPKYYSQFGWKESDNLPYFWPSKNGY